MFWDKDEIITNSDKIEDFLSLGIENIYPNREFLENKLKKGERLSMYLGIDPTGPSLHLGHAIVLKKLGEFQNLGHKAVLLIGDFTGMIGDPTNKTATRKKLSKEQVLENAKLYKKQASIFLNFNHNNRAEIKYNSDWLSKMNFKEVLELASNITVEQMLKRDMFEERQKKGKPIYIHEFLYPLMQGYDSVAINTDGEIGGNDQTFNMLTGRTLMKQMLGKEKFVITTKLLEDGSGVKMGKTEGDIMAFTDDEYEMFGKVMSWTDKMILPGFELATNISKVGLDSIKKELDLDVNPKDIKMKLAFEIVSIFHGKEKAKKAKENFIITFSKGGTPTNMEEIIVEKGADIYDAVSKFVKSKTDFRRLINDKAISEIYGDKITDMNFKIQKDITLKIGKRKFLKIKIRK